MFGALLGLINPVGKIVEAIVEERRREQAAENAVEAQASRERIAALEAQRDILIARASSPMDAIVRALFAVPVAIYCGKLYLWDKVLELGATDPLSPWLKEVAMVIIGGYFLHAAATRLMRR